MTIFQPTKLPVWSPILALSFAVLGSGCGSGTTSGSGSNPPPASITSVTASCSPTSIITSQTSACIATVSGTGSFSSSVTWSVSPTSIGTISSAGVFTPVGAGTATISATSTQDSTKSGNATVTVTVTTQSAITSVSVICSPASVLTTQTSSCAATVQGTGSYSPAVTWTATDGTITSSRVFTPSGAGTAIITATSTQDTTKSGTASVVVGGASSNKEWVWMGGSDTVNAVGNYGTQGVPAATNVPGARDSAVTWTDGSGDFWLYSGYGNDLWKFSPPTNMWTWVNGSNTVGS